MEHDIHRYFSKHYKISVLLSQVHKSPVERRWNGGREQNKNNMKSQMTENKENSKVTHPQLYKT
jgi:hypothetical protein